MKRDEERLRAIHKAWEWDFGSTADRDYTIWEELLRIREEQLLWDLENHYYYRTRRIQQELEWEAAQQETEGMLEAPEVPKPPTASSLRPSNTPAGCPVCTDAELAAEKQVMWESANRELDARYGRPWLLPRDGCGDVANAVMAGISAVNPRCWDYGIVESTASIPWYYDLPLVSLTPRIEWIMGHSKGVSDAEEAAQVQS
jgi:hypothetical protein